MADDPAILNWRRYDARLTSSGQPDAAGIAAIAALGVGTIVNLAPHDHPAALPDEASEGAAAGMRYVHIPVAFNAPAEADFDAFRAAMASSADDAVHVHCIVNARVTAFLYRLRRDALGEAAAAAEMQRVWRPGGVWARFVGCDADMDRPHRYAGRDY